VTASFRLECCFFVVIIVNLTTIMEMMTVTTLMMSCSGAVCSIGFQGALPQSVWVQAQLQWPRRSQVGPVHRQERPLWNTLLDSLSVYLFVCLREDTDMISCIVSYIAASVSVLAFLLRRLLMNYTTHRTGRGEWFEPPLCYRKKNPLMCENQNSAVRFLAPLLACRQRSL